MEDKKFDTLFNQAPMTANTYMLKAIESIDRAFGAGYAQSNPNLIGAFMQTCAMDFQTMINHQHIEDGSI